MTTKIERSIHCGKWVTLPGQTRPVFIPNAELIAQTKAEEELAAKRTAAFTDALRRAEATKDVRHGVKPPKALIMGLAMQAAERYQVVPEDILGKSRKRPIALARKDVCLALCKLRYTCTGIAQALGIDHTTVLYHWKMENDPSYSKHKRAITNKYLAKKAA